MTISTLDLCPDCRAPKAPAATLCRSCDAHENDATEPYVAIFADDTPEDRRELALYGVLGVVGLALCGVVLAVIVAVGVG